MAEWSLVAGEGIELTDARDTRLLTAKAKRGVVAFNDELAAPDGADGIGFRQPDGGAVARDAGEKLAEQKSLVDAGGVGDGSTIASGAVAIAEGWAARQLVLPAGRFKVSDGTAMSKEWVGEGEWVFGDEVVPLARRSPVHSAVQASHSLGDIAQFKAAVRARALTVCVVCDSIGEGVNECSYADSWAGLFSEELKRRLVGVEVTVVNLSIAGLGMGHLADPAFVAVTVGSYTNANTQFYKPAGMDPTYPMSDVSFGCIVGAPELWPAGSTVGKSWLNHVRDVNADLVLIGLVQNHVDGDTAAWVTAAKSVVTAARGWTKAPSLAFMTTAQPTRKHATWRGYAPKISSGCAAARDVAIETNCSLLDAERVFHLYRDGVDLAASRRQAIDSLTLYPTAWAGAVNGMSAPADTALPVKTGALGSWLLTTLYATKIFGPQSFRDGTLQGLFKPTAASGQGFGIMYRRDPATGYAYEAQVEGEYVRLYYLGAAPVLLASTWLGGAFAAGSNNAVLVDVKGARHQVWVNGVKRLDHRDYRCLRNGTWGFEMDGTGEVSRLSLLMGAARTIGPPVFTEEELLGFSSAEYVANAATLGGDGIHHPSRLGHYAVYFASTLGLVSAAEAALHSSESAAVHGEGSAVAGALASTDYVEVLIDGAAGAPVLVSGSAGLLGATAGHQAPLLVSAAGAKNVTLRQNGTTTLATAVLTFAAPGAYLVLATAAASHNGGSIKHSVQAFAVKVA